MSQFAILEYIGKKIDETIAAMSINIAKGQCSGIEEYKYQCGVIYGLQKAKEIAEQAETDIQSR